MGRKSFLSFFCLALVPFSLGSASFAVTDEAYYEFSLGDKESAEAVCYNSSTKAYYTSIEKGLEKASRGETIYVIPGTNPTILKDCEIKSGVTLTLPHGVDLSTSYDSSTKKLTLVETESLEKYHDDDDDLPIYNKDGEKTTINNSGNLAYETAKYEKLKVTIGDGVTLTNNGTLNIGGILSGGVGSGKYAGHTAYYHAKIYLEGSASIVSNGTLYCYGYIFGDGKKKTEVSFGSGSTTYAPFVVREHRGGTAFLGWNESSKTTTPFNRFFVASFINTDYSFPSGSVLYGMCDLYASNQHNRTNIALIGNSSTSGLIVLNEGSSFTGYLDKSTKVNCVNTYGGFVLNPLSMTLTLGEALGISIGDISLSTKGLLFPLSWYLNITLNKSGADCTVDCTAQDLKILPGASLTINEGVTVKVSKLVIYDQEEGVNEWEDANGTYKSDDNSYSTGNKFLYGQDTLNGTSVKDIPGKVTVNGSLEVTGSLGGTVYTDSPNASLSLSGNELSSDEITGISGIDKYLVLKEYGVISTTTYSFKAKAKAFDDLKVGGAASVLAAESYVSAIDSDGSIGFGNKTDAVSISGLATVGLAGGPYSYSLSTGALIGDEVRWSSSDEKVLSVSGSLLSASVSPKGEGTATLSASVYSGGALMGSASKEVRVYNGYFIVVDVLDKDGSLLEEQFVEDKTEYTFDLSNYIVDGTSSTVKSGLPDSKTLYTVSSWSVSGGTASQGEKSGLTSVAMANGSVTVSGTSGSVVSLKPSKYESAVYYLAYMTAHADKGTSSLETSSALDESKKVGGATVTLDAAEEYCYILSGGLSGGAYTLKAKGGSEKSGWSTSYYDVSITDGTNEVKSTWSRSGNWPYTYSCTESSQSCTISHAISVSSTSSKHSF